MNESLIVLGIFVFLVLATLSAGIKIVPQGYNWTSALAATPAP